MIRQTIACVVLLALVGSGCSFRPLHGSGPIVGELVSVSFAEPSSRLEQIAYRELAPGLESSPQHNTPRVQIVATSSSRPAALSATPPARRGGIAVGSAQTMEVTVTLTAIVSEQGEDRFHITRFATALFQRNSTDHSISPHSVLATSAAEEKAGEDAAMAAAQSLRMALPARLASAGL